MTGAERHTRFVATAGVLAAGVPYVAGVALLVRNAASGEPDGYLYWQDPLLAAMTFAVVGALIRVRLPDNRVGVLLEALGVLSAVQLFTGEYHAYVAHLAPTLPAGEQAGRLAEAAEIAFLFGFLLLLQIFPDGSLLGSRWRVVAGCTAAAIVYGFVGTWTDYTDTNAVLVYGFYAVIYPIAFVGSIAATAVRWRRGDGRVRAQLKWVVFAAIANLVVGFSGALGLSEAAGRWLQSLTLVLVPVATVVAILRYRLYDIDRLISRTLSYAVLTTLLVGVYLALVTTTTRLLPDGSSLAVAASTLAAAAFFQPLRRRVQTLVDRRFNRARYDADRTVAAFSAQLREEVDLDTVRTDLLTVVHDTVQPASVGLWLRNGQDA